MPGKTPYDSLYESLGDPFWKNHEEAPRILRWVRTVDAIHNWLEESKEHYDHFMEQHNRETKNFHLPADYIDERFEDICMCLDGMDPYIPSALEGGTHEERVKEVAEHITDELWSGDLDFLGLFSDLIDEVLSSGDERLMELIRPVSELAFAYDTVKVYQHRYCEPGNLVPGGRQKKPQWQGLLLELIIIFVWAVIVFTLVGLAVVAANEISMYFEGK